MSNGLSYMKDQLGQYIKAKYRSEADCARALGWHKQRLNKITNGVKEPDVTELWQMAEALEVSVHTLAVIFLSYWSPNGQQKGA